VPARRTTLTITGSGVVMLGSSTGRVNLTGMAVASAAGLAFAVYSGSASKLVVAGLPPTGVMALLFTTAGVLLMPVLLIADTSWLRTPQGLLLTVYLAAVTTAVAYALYGVGLRTVRVRTCAVLSLADPGAAALLGLLVLGEPARLTTILGLVLLLLGLGLVGVRSADAAPARREGLRRAYDLYGPEAGAGGNQIETRRRADTHRQTGNSASTEPAVPEGAGSRYAPTFARGGSRGLPGLGSLAVDPPRSGAIGLPADPLVSAISANGCSVRRGRYIFPVRYIVDRPTPNKPSTPPAPGAHSTECDSSTTPAPGPCRSSRVSKMADGSTS
jgi:hypothetical protein